MAKNKKPMWERFWDWTAPARKISMETTETALVVLYAANGLTAFLILFDFVPASTAFKRAIGSIAFGFSVFALIAYINKGVKHQSTLKRGE